MKCVDVLCQTRTSVDNAFEHTLNDYCDAEEWIGPGCFQIKRMKLAQQYNLLNGRSTKVRETTRTWHDLARGMAQSVEEKHTQETAAWDPSTFFPNMKVTSRRFLNPELSSNKALFLLCRVPGMLGDTQGHTNN